MIKMVEIRTERFNDETGRWEQIASTAVPRPDAWEHVKRAAGRYGGTAGMTFHGVRITIHYPEGAVTVPDPRG